MFYKAARVEYVPVGVVGAIVPWNYPFHNVFNPLVAALYAGNAIVIKAFPPSLPLKNTCERTRLYLRVHTRAHARICLYAASRLSDMC